MSFTAPVCREADNVPHGGLYAVGHRLDVLEALAQVMRQFFPPVTAPRLNKINLLYRSIHLFLFY